MSWYNDRNWMENPFNVRPDPDKLVGYGDLRAQAIGYIESGDLFLVYGPIGSGKTTLLKWVKKLDSFRDMDQDRAKHFKIRYFDASTLKMQDVKQFSKISLGEKLGKYLWNRNIKKRVILIDEAQELDRDTSKQIKSMYDENDLHAIGLASLDKNLDLSDSFMDRIGQRTMKMRPMKMEEAKKMIEERIQEGENPFTDSAMETIIESSNFIPRKILENCEHIAMKQEGRIGQNDITSLLEEKSVKEAESNDLTFSELMDKVTPTQKEILKEIKTEGSVTAEELEEEGIAGSQGSARKQLSRLSDLDKLEERGIFLRLVEKQNPEEKPYRWQLTSNAKRLMAQD